MNHLVMLQVSKPPGPRPLTGTLPDSQGLRYGTRSHRRRLARPAGRARGSSWYSNDKPVMNVRASTLSPSVYHLPAFYLFPNKRKPCATGTLWPANRQATAACTAWLLLAPRQADHPCDQHGCPAIRQNLCPPAREEHYCMTPPCTPISCYQQGCPAVRQNLYLHPPVREACYCMTPPCFAIPCYQHGCPAVRQNPQLRPPVREARCSMTPPCFATPCYQHGCPAVRQDS